MEKYELNGEAGVKPMFQAMEKAIAIGMNCYSKPGNPAYTDQVFEDHHVYYYNWKGRLAEITILLN